MDIFARLRDKSGFTDTENKIAVSNPRNVGGGPRESDLFPKASVIRLCRKVGLSGTGSS